MKSIKTILVVTILGIAFTTAIQAQSFLTNGLIAYYPFNGNSNDESGNGHDGTIYGVGFAADRFGSINSAGSFGYGKYIDTGFGSGSYTQMTIAVWALSTNWGANNALVVSRTASGETSSGITTTHDNVVGYYWNPTQNFGIGAEKQGFKPNDGKWHQYVSSYDGISVKFFADGILIATNASAFSIFINASFLIGLDNYFGLGWADRYWYGYLDDIRIYTRALSSSEVAQLYAIESQFRVNLIKAVKPSFVNLSIGTNYQLQVSGDASTFTNYGTAFSATNTSMVYPQYFDVENYNKLFFRLQLAP